MSIFSLRPLLAAIMACTLASCASVSRQFRQEEVRGARLYSTALQDICRYQGMNDSDASAISSITVYRTAFREKLVETGSIVAVAQLNDDSRRKTVKYLRRDGFRQEMYLVNVKGRCHPNAWFYFSVWYRISPKTFKEEQYGFGKAYMGVGNDSAGTIHFSTCLAPKTDESGYYFSTTRKAEFFFVLDKLPEDTLRVNRIVMEEKNKFGGPRPYVFDVAKSFAGDLTTLNFHKVSRQ